MNTFFPLRDDYKYKIIIYFNLWATLTVIIMIMMQSALRVSVFTSVFIFVDIPNVLLQGVSGTYI